VSGTQIPERQYRCVIAQDRSYVASRLAPDDQVDKLLRSGVGDIAHTDRFAVAEHHDAIGDLEDFVEPVGYIDHADVVLAELSQHDEEVCDILREQTGRRFVQDQEVAFAGQRPGNGNQRFFGTRQPGARIDRLKSQPTLASASRVVRSQAARSMKGPRLA